MKRPPIDKARAAVIAERIAASDTQLDDDMCAYWCVDCKQLWFENSIDEPEYATWLCYKHYRPRQKEWVTGFDPRIDPMPLWGKA